MTQHFPQSPYSPQYHQGGDAQPTSTQQPKLPAENPGKAMGIAGFILALVFWPVGVILSIVSMVTSRKAGFTPTGLAVAGLVISTVWGLAVIVILGVLLTFDGEPSAQQSTGTVPSVQETAPTEETAPAEENVLAEERAAIAPFTCEDLVLEAVAVEQPNPLVPALLEIYEPTTVVDDIAGYNDGTVTIPDGEHQVDVLECTGDGQFNDGSAATVNYSASVDVNGELWVFWEPVD